MHKAAPTSATATAIASSTSASIHSLLALRPGLILRCSGSRHAHDHGRQGGGQAGAGLHLLLLLHGQVHVSYGGSRHRLGRSAAAESGACEAAAELALVSLQRPEAFARHDEEDGAPECKLGLHLSPEWLDQADLRLPDKHLGVTRLHAAAHLRRLGQAVIAQAEALSRSTAEPRALSRLRLESQTLELLGEALQLGAAGPRLAMVQRMRQARELLDSGAADRWSLADIALELGLHENTLQRCFRQAHGCSVFEHLRQRRLARAHDLLQQGSSVAQAALEAGYDNPANFATAFKRQYGRSPSQLRG